ncbi:MAG: hypothetical protein NTV70_04030 [Acidobacteria bacterium]|nr:hypothetical protein [Acidobacteriota bacterium]
MLYPTLKLSEHWFAYGAVQLRSTPYFPYDAYYPEATVKADMIQAFLGYARQVKGVTVMAKAGRLSSAFGSFAIRYDDVENPLIDQPLVYSAPVRLNPNQLACGTNDILHQQAYAVDVVHYCGGAPGHNHGVVPVTLYGLPGIELGFASRHFDGRFQVTNSSPINPLSLTAAGQSAQWTAGGGFTPWHSLRIGASAYRGSYLGAPLRPLLPAGGSLRDYAATGAGVDAQFQHGRTLVRGEWQWFQLPMPRFRQQPSLQAGYVEAKVTMTPRIYLAARGGAQTFGAITDTRGVSADQFAPSRGFLESGLGFRLNRMQLVKLSYQWVRLGDQRGTRDNVAALQFVTSVHQISKAIR